MSNRLSIDLSRSKVVQRRAVVGFESVNQPDRLRRVTMHPPHAPPMVPRVAFQVDPSATDKNKGWITRTVWPEDYTIEEGTRTIASRAQMPLKLAWAISIHKSQGMTISTLEVELASCFEAGQVYVALSRAVSLTSTRILSFSPKKVFCNPKVHAFYAAIEAQQRSQQQQQAAKGGEPGRGGGGATWSAVLANGASHPPPPLVPPSLPPPNAAAAPPKPLSAEQKARIEASKAAALARRQSMNGGGGGASQAPGPPPMMPPPMPYGAGAWGR